MHNINYTIFDFIYGLSGKSFALDSIFVIITDYIAYAVVVATALYILFAFPFFTNDASIRIRRIFQAIEIGTSVFVTFVIVWVLKVLVSAPRPFDVYEAVKPLVAATSYESFPSSHAALTMAIASGVFIYHKKWGRALIIFSIIVAVTRLYVGVHFPIDVLSGMAFGYLVPIIIHKVFARRTDSVSQ